MVMQLVALYMLFHFNRFHEAAFLGVASKVTGKVNEKYNNIEYYFKLKKANEALVKENEELRNRLHENFDVPDTALKMFRDTVAFDSLGHFRKWAYLSAKVISNSVNFQNNYFTINLGSKHGIRKEMGVMSPSGVAGTVINTSENMAIVMSMLNIQFRLSAKLKKSGETGAVFWDGKNASYVTMINLPKSMPVNKGDTIVTSQYSTRYPQGVMVGTVAEVVDDKSSNFYTLKIKTATDFYNLEHANIVQNLFRDEQKKLEDSIKTNE